MVKPETSGSARLLTVTSNAAMMTMRGLLLLRSIRPPAGVWDTSPTMPAIVSTIPTVASFQP